MNEKEVINFIENYCLVNGNHIKLNNFQKEFIKWMHAHKNKKIK